MPPDDISRLLQEVRSHMHDGSRFLATFACTDQESRSKRFKDWYHTRDFFVEQGERHRYRVAFVPEWRHPDDPSGIDTLVKFTPLNA
jgi:hypothetical protein